METLREMSMAAVAFVILVSPLASLMYSISLLRKPKQTSRMQRPLWRRLLALVLLMHCALWVNSCAGWFRHASRGIQVGSQLGREGVFLPLMDYAYSHRGEMVPGRYPQEPGVGPEPLFETDDGRHIRFEYFVVPIDREGRMPADRWLACSPEPIHEPWWLLWKPFRNDSARSVLFGDGHVEAMNEEKFQQGVAVQRTASAVNAATTQPIGSP